MIISLVEQTHFLSAASDAGELSVSCEGVLFAPHTNGANRFFLIYWEIVRLSPSNEHIKALVL